ncbi:4987_t:CDS:2 [Dentiscutata erythropus]|uniref:4987_t:CDS:1 n=1 Tax=Dentiscutata erythropus TaxID=1348616 RepID=A0A9N8Z5G6_9GLOM|nr:4987_t:CDS:2 [Dentiscutata erythropus]
MHDVLQLRSSQSSQFNSGSTVVSLTSDLSQPTPMQTPKSEYSNFEGSSQRSQSYSGSTLVLSTSDLSQLIPTPKSENFKISLDEEKSTKNLKESTPMSEYFKFSSDEKNHLSNDQKD